MTHLSLLLVLLTATLMRADLHIEKVTKLGCKVNQIENGLFSTDVWATQEPEPQYLLLLSVRDKRSEDCSSWMDMVERKIKDLKSKPKGGKSRSPGR